MLTLRNGSGLHPFYLPGISQPVQSPQMGSLLDETSGSKGVRVFPGNQEASVRTMSGLSGKPASSDCKILMPRTSENCNSGPLFVMEPSTNAHYRPFNAPMPSKLVFLECEGTLQRSCITTITFGNESGAELILRAVLVTAKAVSNGITNSKHFVATVTEDAAETVTEFFISDCQFN
ncbi:hypothetical protein Cgig2_018516 [Carnegiea gigantea]|uniref:Uncharacterized protein n=1 Tax=Carnegiea gigantea TaxID=171969 RepID=A0A9Q1KNE4_9CARY|nr:hypothetical protein Cgig2_018516 [Carnegiea gigantea]